MGPVAKSQNLNTNIRSQAFLRANRQLCGRVGKGLDFKQRKKGCRFNPDAMPN